MFCNTLNYSVGLKNLRYFYIMKAILTYTPILDIIMSKPSEPIEDYLLETFVIDIIKGKMEMQAILHRDLTFNN